VKKIFNVKTWLEQEITFAGHSKFRAFRFHKENDEVIVDVKEATNQEEWRRVGSILNSVPNFPPTLVENNYQEIEIWEQKIDKAIEKGVFEETQIQKLKEEINSIREGEQEMWSFEKLRTWKERIPQEEPQRIQPEMSITSKKDQFLPSIILGTRKKVASFKTKVSLVLNDLVAYIEDGNLKFGTVTNIKRKLIDILPWDDNSGSLYINLNLKSIEKKWIIGTGIKISSKRKIEDNIFNKLKEIMEKYHSLNSQSQSQSQSQSLEVYETDQDLVFESNLVEEEIEEELEEELEELEELEEMNEN